MMPATLSLPCDVQKDEWFCVAERVRDRTVSRLMAWGWGRQDAEDLVSDTAIRLAEKSPIRLQTAQPTTFFNASVWNHAKNTRKLAKKHFSLDEMLADSDDDPICSFDIADELAADPVQVAVNRQICGTINNIINSLRPDWREVLTLWLQERSYRQIAEECERSEDTVRQQIHRAKQAVIDQYRHMTMDPDERAAAQKAALEALRRQLYKARCEIEDLDRALMQTSQQTDEPAGIIQQRQRRYRNRQQELRSSIAIIARRMKALGKSSA